MSPRRGFAEWGGFGGQDGFDEPDHLRVGDAERDEVAVSLHDHFAQGRLNRDELDERLEAALSAKTAGDLREVTRDLPDLRTGSGRREGEKGPWPGPGPGRGPRRGLGLADGMPHHPGPWHGGSPRRHHGHGHHGHRHHGGFVPALIGFLIIATIVAGPGGALAALFKVMLVGWLVLLGAGLFAHRRWHHLRGHRDPHALH